jgi:CHAD domain-containing protein
LGAQPLVAHRQLAPFARAHHALGVGVPAAAGVAFGGDQHVLAERGQLMAAQRTAVRRRLAVRRATHRPPRGRGKARGHRSIVPPSGLRPLATALAVLGLGVGIALAKSELERRADRSKSGRRARRRARRPSLRPGEPYAEGLRRVVLGQLDVAIELLEEYPGGVERGTGGARVGGARVGGARVGGARTGGARTGGANPAEHTVHETRKTLKRLRALVALLRDELGAKRYARENAALRDCARRLAGARDAEVMVGTLDGLLERHPKRLVHSPGVRALRAHLLAERDAATASGIGDPLLRAAVAGELRAVRARVERWELRPRGFKLLAPGLERLYRQGRRGLRTARRRGSVEALHAWRKRVKDLRYAVETLDRAGKPGAGGAGAGAGSMRIRRVARRAEQLGEVLGEEHDLALLDRGVRERSGHFAGERRTRKRLLKLIARRRRALRKRALREGERLYRRPPRRFVRRMRRAA